MLTFLSGKDKRGKTLLAQEMVRAVLDGAPLLGHFGAACGPVVAAFLDDPLSMTLERLTVLGLRQHPELFLVDPLRYRERALAFLETLTQEVRRVRARLAVVDALYLLSPTSPDAGNDASRMTPLMRGLDRLAVESGAAVLAVAHDNKAGQDVAGSYAIRAMAKTILRLALLRGSDSTDLNGAPTTPRRLLMVESKLVAAQSFMLDLHGPSSWAYLGTSSQVRVGDLRQAILSYLGRLEEAVPEREIHENVEGRREAKQQALRELLESQEVVRTGEGKKGKPYLYARVRPPGDVP